MRQNKKNSATKSFLINRFGQIQTPPPSDGLCLVELFMRLEGQEKKDSAETWRKLQKERFQVEATIKEDKTGIADVNVALLRFETFLSG